MARRDMGGGGTAAGWLAPACGRGRGGTLGEGRQCGDGSIGALFLPYGRPRRLGGSLAAPWLEVDAAWGRGRATAAVMAMRRCRAAACDRVRPTQRGCAGLAQYGRAGRSQRGWRSGAGAVVGRRRHRCFPFFFFHFSFSFYPSTGAASVALTAGQRRGAIGRRVLAVRQPKANVVRRGRCRHRCCFSSTFSSCF